MFFIIRLTENTNLAASIPASEQVFNAARVNISLARSRFAELDVITGKHRSMQQQFTASYDERNDTDRSEVSSSVGNGTALLGGM